MDISQQQWAQHLPPQLHVSYDVLQGNVRNLVCLICARKGIGDAELNSNFRGLDCAYGPAFGCGSIQRGQVPRAIVLNRISLKTTGFALLKGNVFAGACSLIPFEEKCYPGVHPGDLKLVVNTNNVTCRTNYRWIRKPSQNNEDTYNFFTFWRQLVTCSSGFRLSLPRRRDRPGLRCRQGCRARSQLFCAESVA